MTDLPIRADLLIHGAALVATVDDDRRELAGGWVAITDGLISGVGGSTDPMPDAERIIDAGGCLVTPGLVNTHHHLSQTLTRAYPPMTSAPLFGWLQSLYPLWTAAIDEEAEYLAAWVGLAMPACCLEAPAFCTGGGGPAAEPIPVAEESSPPSHETGAMALSSTDCDSFSTRVAVT